MRAAMCCDTPSHIDALYAGNPHTRLHDVLSSTGTIRFGYGDDEELHQGDREGLGFGMFNWNGDTDWTTEVSADFPITKVSTGFPFKWGATLRDMRAFL